MAAIVQRVFPTRAVKIAARDRGKAVGRNFIHCLTGRRDTKAARDGVILGVDQM